MNLSVYLGGLVGGVVIGLGCMGLMLFNGRILGVSSVLGGALKFDSDSAWRWAFIVGMVSASFAAYLAHPTWFPTQMPRSLGVTLLGSVLVGAGTQLGSGCTSGHGICGIGRLSIRSVVATMVFMTTAALSVFVIEHVLRGAP